MLPANTFIEIKTPSGFAWTMSMNLHTEDRIEREAERFFNKLDRHFMLKAEMTQAMYDATARRFDECLERMRAKAMEIAR